jgi:hypothetical protein
MIKLEIIANQAIEEDIIEAFENAGYGENFTWFTPVRGRGGHGWREGSAIWPEENIFYYLVIDDKDLAAVSSQIEAVKKRFPDEGLRCYICRDIDRLL